MWRIIYEKGKIWSWKEVSGYRIFSVIFFGIFFFSLLHELHHPLWVNLSLVTIGIILATYSKGIDIDAHSKTVHLWWKLLGFNRTRKEKFSNFQGIYLRTYLVPVPIGINYSVLQNYFEVWLIGKAGSLKIYRSGNENENRKELGRVTTLMNLPEIQTPIGRLPFCNFWSLKKKKLILNQ